MALCPVEFVAQGIDGDLQGFGGVDGGQADQLLRAAAVEVGAPDPGGLGVATFEPFGPVDLAHTFHHLNVEDQPSIALDEAYTICRVAQVDPFDGVGQAALGIELGAVGTHIGHRLRRNAGRAVTVLVTGRRGDQAGLEAGACTLGRDLGQILRGDAWTGEAQQRRIDGEAQVLWR